MIKNVRCWIAILASSLLLTACGGSLYTAGNTTIRGGPAEAAVPRAVTSVSQVPASQSTYHYMITIYPGLDENFNADPKLTLAEYNQVAQLDWYCARQVEQLSGRIKEMIKQGGTFGALQGILGSIGARMAFGNLIRPLEYLTYIGMTGAGGGLASGTITFDLMMNSAHGYCMTGLVHKANELEGKLKRLFIVPLYVGAARMPGVTNAPAPNYTGGRPGSALPVIPLK